MASHVFESELWLRISRPGIHWENKKKSFLSSSGFRKTPLLTAGDLQLKVPQYGVRVEWANGHTRAIIQIFMITIFSMIVRQV